MKQRPASEADSRSVGQEVPSLLLHLIVLCCAHKTLQFFLFLCRMNPVYIFKPNSFNLHFSIISHLRLGLSSDFPTNMYVVFPISSLILSPLIIFLKSGNYEARYYAHFSTFLLFPLSLVHIFLLHYQ